MNIIQAIETRASVRAFTSKAVADATIEKLFSAARWAPSDKNSQPWSVAVVTGATKNNIAAELSELNQQQVKPNPDFIIDEPLTGIYKQRAFQCGIDLYQAMDIKREDKDKRFQQWQKNFRFFDAPVGLLFFVEPKLGVKACVDTGIFIQSVMLTAMEFGLATCAQGALAFYPDAIRTHLSEQFQDKKLLCGMSLGYPDLTAPENNYRTQRADVQDIIEFFT